ncbi:MAG: hydroxymethylbilane synthase [Wenzhouxiangella sp.]
MSDQITLATRQSKLALWQTEWVAAELRRHHPGLKVTLLPLSTRGDEVLDRSLSEIGGKGLFLKELERALLDGKADVAVHSLKDVPAESPPGLALSVVLPRADWADWWLTADGRRPAELPPGARVGTSSLRRQSQLLRLHPGLQVVPIRGNVQTRLGLMTSGQVDAVVLAAAGLKRLEIPLAHHWPLTPPDFLPAPGQGVIVTQCRSGDAAVSRLLEPLECRHTRDQVKAERAVVAAMGADCRMPLAALARIGAADELDLWARLCSADGRQTVEARVYGGRRDAAAIGAEVGRQLLDAGGAAIMDAIGLK